MRKFEIEKNRVPNFIIAGAQKCGTTSIFKVLYDHTEVFLPESKEVHFFDRNQSFNKGIDWYKNFFSKSKSEKVIMDITPNYMNKEYVPERIKKLLPDVKLIFVLRNPVTRAYSNYWDNIRNQNEHLPFNEAINHNPAYIEKGLYYKHINRFLEYFNKEDIFIFLSEELFSHPEAFYKKLCSKLDIDFKMIKDMDRVANFARVPRIKIVEKTFLSQNRILKIIRRPIPGFLKSFVKKLDEKFNMKKIKRPEIDEETKKYLKVIFRDDIKSLEKLFDLNLNLWLNY